MYFCHTKSKRFRIIHGEIIAQMINYQQYNSQSYYNGGYRYFFNGQEADNEVLGECGLAGTSSGSMTRGWDGGGTLTGKRQSTLLSVRTSSARATRFQ